MGREREVRLRGEREPGALGSVPVAVQLLVEVQRLADEGLVDFPGRDRPTLDILVKRHTVHRVERQRLRHPTYPALPRECGEGVLALEPVPRIVPVLEVRLEE